MPPFLTHMHKHKQTGLYTNNTNVSYQNVALNILLTKFKKIKGNPHPTVK